MLTLNSNKSYHFYPLINLKKILKKDFKNWTDEDYFYFYINSQMYLEILISNSIREFHEFYSQKIFPNEEKVFEYFRSKKSDKFHFFDKVKYFVNKYELDDKKYRELENLYKNLANPRHRYIHAEPIFRGSRGNNMWDKEINNEVFTKEYVKNFNKFSDIWNSLEKDLFLFLKNKSNKIEGFNNCSIDGKIDPFFKIEKLNIKKWVMII